MKDNLLKGIIKENPVFVSLLAMCPTLAVTKSIESAVGMGLLVVLTLICTNAFISLISRFVPKEAKTPIFIIVIASIVTVIKMLCNAYLPSLYDSLGVFISLIVVNCIILGRAEAYASKNKVIPSIIDGLSMGLGFTLALTIVGFFREVIGTGGLTFGEYLPLPKVTFTPLSDFKISLFTSSPGGFLTLAFILATLSYISTKRQEKPIKEATK